MLPTDAIKWTDVMTAWSTLAQALFVIGGIIVALIQLGQSRAAEVARATDDVFALLSRNDVEDAIDRVSTFINPRRDWETIRARLTLADGDPDRVQCEADIALLTNVFEQVEDRFARGLIHRKRFLRIYDELTLFVWHALAKAHEHFDQPDYGPLMRLAQLCRDNYIANGGENHNLINLQIPNTSPKRFKIAPSTDLVASGPKLKFRKD